MMTQLKQMFAQLMSSNPTPISPTATATETPRRDNKRQRPSATPPSVKDQAQEMEYTKSDMDHHSVDDDEVLATTVETQNNNFSLSSLDANQPTATVPSQSDPSNPPTLGTLKEYEQHGA
jgi:hypothetical protein